MRLTILIVLFASSAVHAVTCPAVEYSVRISTKITVTGGQESPRQVSVRAPRLLSGSTLTSIRVWVSETKESGTFDLILPLDYEVKGEEVHAELYTRENWRHVEIVAYYGDGICDPKLETTL